MGRVGILVVSYGSRGAAIIDALCNSENYNTDIYLVDKQQNPFNANRAVKHAVIPDLDIKKICNFVKKHKDKIDFGIVGPEKPIINGVRDLVEKETGVPIICPTKEYAIEGSKIAQRLLFQEAVPEANPKFKIFDQKQYTNLSKLKKDIWKWLDHFKNQVVVKPDKPAAGKGVGVWGDHFNTRKQFFEYFLSNYKHGPVIIEEKILGEESSFQAFCDGKHLIPLPETRDYKRAFDNDFGPNTGGMGSYKDVGNFLPFMTLADREKEIEIANRIFRKLKGKGTNPGLRGIPFYIAFMHTGSGSIILENNSRPGDPEIQNLIPILRDDLVDLCFNIIDGHLKKINFESQATVVTYKVPPTYGGKDKGFVGDRAVYLDEAYKLSEKYDKTIKIYPGAIELEANQTFALGSRTVCVVGIADNIQSARTKSLEGIKAIKGGSLWYRKDIASREHIMKSVLHMEKLRRQ